MPDFYTVPTPTEPSGVSWVVVVVASLLSLAAGAALGALVFADTSAAEVVEAEPATAAPEPSVTAEPPPEPKKPEKSVLQLAAEGEKDAIKQLQAKPLAERSVEDNVALAKARIAGKRFEISEIARKTELVPAYGKDRDTLRNVLNFAKDREVAIDLLQMLTTLPGEQGPDHLYRLSSSRLVPQEISELAEKMLLSSEVRQKASPALEILLKFKLLAEADEKDCPAVAKLLEEAKTVADRRIYGEMKSVYGKRGCGVNKAEDCWACLRKPDLVKEAIPEIRPRLAPM